MHFSLETDVTRLVDAGIVDQGLEGQRDQGHRDVVGRGVRGPQGQPRAHPDLGRPRRSRASRSSRPNPGSSGSARWNILAAWAHIAGNGGSEDEAKAYLTKLLNNTIALPSSGRDATTSFTEGNGDVLLSYENEAILAKQGGADVDYVVPDDTLLIENPAAVTKDAVPDREGRSWTFLTSPDGAGGLRASPASGPSSTASTIPRSRAPTTPPTRSRRRRSCSRSTRTSVAGPRRRRSSSTTARTAARWASSRSCRQDTGKQGEE